MRPNKIKQMWKSNQCVTLGWLSISHGFTAEVMARRLGELKLLLRTPAALFWGVGFPLAGWIVIGLIPAGYLADRYGRKPVAVWGLLQFTLFTGLTALAPSYGWFVVLRFLNGLGQGVLFAVPYIMISEFMRPSHRATIDTCAWSWVGVANQLPAANVMPSRSTKS